MVYLKEVEHKKIVVEEIVKLRIVDKRLFGVSQRVELNELRLIQHPVQKHRVVYVKAIENG